MLTYLIIGQIAISGNSILYGKDTFKLACIESPAIGSIQYYMATDFLNQLVAYGDIKLEQTGDRYYAYVNGMSINFVILANGYGYADPCDCPEYEMAVVLEQGAKMLRLGIWSIPQKTDLSYLYIVGDSRTKTAYYAWTIDVDIPLKYRVFFKNYNEAILAGYTFK